MTPERAVLEAVVDAGQSTRCTECGTTLRPNALVECVLLEDGTLEATRCFGCHEHAHDGDGWLVEGQLAPSISPSGRSRLVLSGATVVDRSV
ncbi:hypothetical protein [Natronosalvus halobius]|uniref:hypothetical protein n=1 Tax=Natronosalvus halobius TaxID=2953746 RepID=UPI0020A227F1|nr:hypothetical protein [Natronosalvus halobius]USZ73734.1 hypothetical protein NGM15_18530 [Natronosalvus halobius]